MQITQSILLCIYSSNSSTVVNKIPKHENAYDVVRARRRYYTDATLHTPSENLGVNNTMLYKDMLKKPFKNRGVHSTSFISFYVVNVGSRTSEILIEVQAENMVLPFPTVEHSRLHVREIHVGSTLKV